MLDLGNLPAFPVPMNASEAGLSRRDWFAAIALQGIVVNGIQVSEDRVLTDDDKHEIMAKRAYALADAMILVSVAMPPKRRIVRKPRKKSQPESRDPAVANPPKATEMSEPKATDRPQAVATPSEG